jgi:hypothetical protein
MAATLTVANSLATTAGAFTLPTGFTYPYIVRNILNNGRIIIQDRSGNSPTENARLYASATEYTAKITVGANNPLYLLDINSGTPPYSATAGTERIAAWTDYSSAYNKNEDYYVVLCQAGEKHYLQPFKLGTATVQRLAYISDANVNALTSSFAFSYNGSYLFWLLGDANNTINVYNRSGDNFTLVTTLTSSNTLRYVSTNHDGSWICGTWASENINAGPSFTLWRTTDFTSWTADDPTDSTSIISKFYSEISGKWTPAKAKLRYNLFAADNNDYYYLFCRDTIGDFTMFDSSNTLAFFNDYTHTNNIFCKTGYIFYNSINGTVFRINPYIFLKDKDALNLISSTVDLVLAAADLFPNETWRRYSLKYTNPSPESIVYNRKTCYFKPIEEADLQLGHTSSTITKIIPYSTSQKPVERGVNGSWGFPPDGIGFYNVNYYSLNITTNTLTGTRDITTPQYNSEKILLSLDSRKIISISKSYRRQILVDDTKDIQFNCIQDGYTFAMATATGITNPISFARRRIDSDTNITGGFRIFNLTNRYAPNLTAYTGADILRTTTIFSTIDEATSATTAQKLQLKVALGASNVGILLRLKTNGGNPRIRTSAFGVTPITYTDLPYTTIGNWKFDVTAAGGGGTVPQTGIIIEGVDKRNETTSDRLIIGTNPWYIFKKSSITANTDLYLYFDMSNNNFDSTSNNQPMLLEYILWRGQESANDINGSKVLYLNNAITDSNKLINWTIKTLDLLTINPIPKKPDPLNTVGSSSSAITGSDSAGWTNTAKISILRRSLLPQTSFQEFTLNDLISWYNPSISNEYTVPYESGIALRPLYSSAAVSTTAPTTQPSFGLQVFIPSGSSSTWRTLFRNNSNTTTYFFKRNTNYRFRILQNFSSTDTTPSLDTELFRIEAWNEYPINTATDKYMDINTTASSDYNSSVGQFIGLAQTESATVTNLHISNNGLTGASRNSFLSKYVFDIVQGSQPAWGTAAPTTFTWRGANGNNYILHDTTSGDNPGISIADIFYGAVSNNVRDPSTAIIPCSSTNQDTSGVYHPDTANDERVLGIGIPYNATQLGTDTANNNVWQFSTNNGTSWSRITSITGNTTNNYFVLWTFNKSSLSPVKIRYSPNTTQKTTRDVSFNFVVYDGSYETGHTFDTNGNINGMTTTNNGKWVTLPTSSIISGTREFKLSIQANNTPPISEITPIDNVHSVTTNNYQYNSLKSFTYNIRDNTNRIVPIKIKNKLAFNYYDFFKAFGYNYPEGTSTSLPGFAIGRFEPANKMKLSIAYNSVLQDISNGRLINEGPYHFVQNSELSGTPFDINPTTVATNYSNLLLNDIADPPTNNTNILGWFRASDIDGRSGTRIGTWSNKITQTGTIGDLTQTTDANKPVLIEDSTGLKFVRFNGSSSYFMNFGSVLTNSINKSASEFTLIIVERNRTIDLTNNYFWGSSTIPNNIYTGYNGGSIIFGAARAGTIYAAPLYTIHNTIVNTTINNNFNIWRFEYYPNSGNTTSNRIIHLNGVRIAQATAGNASRSVENGSSFTQYLGRHINNYYTGDIGEILFYNTRSAPNLTATENYLFYKWNKIPRMQRLISTISNTGTTNYDPIAWYDFSDKSTMILDSNNNITKIYNKIVSSTYTNSLEASGSVEYIENEINGNGVARFITGRTLSILNTGNRFSQYFVDVDTTDNTNKEFTIIVVERRNGGGSFMTGNLQIGYTNDNKMQIRPTTSVSTTLTTSTSWPNTDTTQNPVRIWRFEIGFSYSANITRYTSYRVIYLNGIQLTTSSINNATEGNVIPSSWIPAFGGYSGDLCEVLFFRDIYSGSDMANITGIETYLKYKWQSPSIIIEPTVNETMNLDISMCLWDQTATASRNRTYTTIEKRGKMTPYSLNTMKFTVPILKANSPPYFDLPPAIDISYAYVVAEIGASNEIEVASLIDTIKTIYTPPKNVYIDDDGVRTTPNGPGDLPGFAIIDVNTSVGTWSASTNTTDGFTNLTGLSQTNVYPISTTSGNKIKHTYSAGFNTQNDQSKPSLPYFEIIPWDGTGSDFTEYTYANPSNASVPTETPFGLTTKRIRVYIKTRPHVYGNAINTNENLYVYTNDPAKATKTPNSYSARFNKTQPYSQTSVQRLDLQSITADDTTVFQYSTDNGTTWLDLVFPLTTPLNGTYPIRINPDKILKDDGTPRNTSAILNLCLYETELDIYSLSTVNVTLTILEENLRPIIGLNPSRQLLSYFDSDPTVDSNGNFTLTLKTLINDENRNIIFNELFRFVNNPTDNITNSQPFTITDTNNLISIRKRGFVIRTGNKVSGTITYNDQFDISPLQDGIVALSYPNKNTYNLFYQPNSSTTGNFFIDIYAWDGSQNYDNGSTIQPGNFDPTTNNTFSEKYVRLQFNVRARNTRPTLTSNAIITSDSTANTIDDVVGASNNGFTITSLMNYMSINGIYDDVDTDPAKGIAITDVSAGVADYGVWEFSTDGGISPWSAINIGEAGALHFKSAITTNRIRFRFTKEDQYPTTYSPSLPNLGFLAWDQTNGINDGVYSPIQTTTDTFSSYSVNSGFYVQNINHVNHAPKLTTSTPINLSYSVTADLSYNIPISTIITAVGAAYKERDIDQAGKKGIYIVSYTNTNSRPIVYSTDQAETTTSWNAKLGAWKYTTNGSTYNEIPSTGVALLAEGQNALSFQPDVLYKGTSVITLRLNDGLASSDETFTVTINVSSVNHPPIIVGTTPSFENINNYTIIFNNSQTVSASTLLNEINIRDINNDSPDINGNVSNKSTYGILLTEVQSLTSASIDSVATITYKPTQSSAIQTFTTTSLQTGAIHLSYDGSITYNTATKLNRSGIGIRISFLVWDRSNQGTISTAGYSASPIILTNPRSPYSSSAATTPTLTFNTSRRNYAPVVSQSTIPIVLSTINGTGVSEPVSTQTLYDQITYSDQNDDAEFGFALLSTDISGGSLQYGILDQTTNEISWQDFTINTHVSIGTNNYVRYTSTRNTTNYADFRLVGWDRTSTETSIPTSRGNDTPYSIGSVVFRYNITHVNQRPLLDSGTSSALPAVTYNKTPTLQWTTISTLLKNYTDPDHSLNQRLPNGTTPPQIADKTVGICIIGCDISGVWKWRSGTGGVTNDMGAAITSSNALLLGSSYQVAFQPTKNIDATYKLTYKIWDRSSGTAETYINTTSPTPDVPYSANNGLFTVDVTRINTAPVLDVSSYNVGTVAGFASDNPSLLEISTKTIIDRWVQGGIYKDEDKDVWGYDVSYGLALAPSATYTYQVTRGDFQYKLPSSSWINVPIIQNQRALPLPYGADVLLRYAPTTNSNGRFTFKVYAWDRSDNATAGVPINISTNPDQSYSSSTNDVFINTSYLNHLPTFTNNTYSASPVSSDTASNTGESWLNTLTTLGYDDIDPNDKNGVSIISLNPDPALVGVYQIQSSSGVWSSVVTGSPFLIENFPKYRFLVNQNLTADQLNALMTISPYDGTAVNNSATATITIPVVKINFAPTINTTLPLEKVRTLRVDNKFSPKGGIDLGISMRQFLDDMGFSDANVGEQRGIAIERIQLNDIRGYFQYRNPVTKKWIDFPKIENKKFLFIREKEGALFNRIQFVSTSKVSKGVGSASILFYGWDVTENYQTGSLHQVNLPAASFSQQRGTYKIQIAPVPIVKK